SPFGPRGSTVSGGGAFIYPPRYSFTRLQMVLVPLLDLVPTSLSVFPTSIRPRNSVECTRRDPQHPRALGAGRPGRGEQEEHDEHRGPSSESHHRLASSAVVWFPLTRLEASP